MGRTVPSFRIVISEEKKEWKPFRNALDKKFIICRQKCRQMGGYGIGIAAEFVRQLSKLNSKQYRSCTTERNGPGGG
jgi:hypothetical protein